MKKGKKRSAASRRRAAEARRFYGKRRAEKARTGADVLPDDEAEALSPWRGSAVVVAVLAAIAFLGAVAAMLLG